MSLTSGYSSLLGGVVALGNETLASSSSDSDDGNKSWYIHNVLFGGCYRNKKGMVHDLVSPQSVGCM